MTISVYTPFAVDGGSLLNTFVTGFVECEKYDYRKSWRGIGTFSMVVPADANGAELIKPDMIIYVDEGGEGTVNDSLIINSVENDGHRVTLSGTDLKGLLSYRDTLFPQEEIDAGTYGYDARQGPSGSIIADYITYNCISPADNARIIHGLRIGNTSGGIVNDTYMSRLQPLNEVVDAICENADIGWDITLKLTEEAGYIFDIVAGDDRTNANGPHKCVFAEYLQNAESVKKLDETTARRSVIWTINGSDTDDAVVTAVYTTSDTSLTSGFYRREAVLAANCDLDLTQLYVESNTADMIDKTQISFTLTDPAMYGSFFFVGDKVTVMRDNTQYDQRVIEVSKSYSAGSKRVSLVLGDIPVKKIFDRHNSELSRRADDVKELALEQMTNSGSKVYSGVGEWLDDGHTAEIFNCYKDTDYLVRNSTNARYDHIEGAGNKSAFDGDDFNYDGYNHVEGNNNTLRNCYDTHVGGYANEVGKSTDWNDNNFVYGYRNICDDIARVFVSGYSNQISNVDDSTVFGEHNTLSGDADGMLISGGSNTVTGGMCTTVLGNYNTVENVNHSLVVGQNITVKNQANGSLFCGRGYTFNGAASVVFYAGNGSSSFIINDDQSFYTSENGTKKFEVASSGIVTALRYDTSGADYGEYSEWADGNADNEDRCGILVMLCRDKIVPAHGDDILGAISARASVVGNAYEEYWHGKYLTDVYGRIVYDKDGKPMLSPDYDPEREYIPRSQRPEWDIVGLVGRLIIRDDGSCKVGEFVSARRGIGTSCYHNTGVRVLKRIDVTHIEVLIK